MLISMPRFRVNYRMYTISDHLLHSTKYLVDGGFIPNDSKEKPNLNFKFIPGREANQMLSKFLAPTPSERLINTMNKCDSIPHNSGAQMSAGG